MSRPGVSLLAQGEPMIWLTGGALATCVCMIAGLLLLVLWYGLPSFWPARLVLIEQHDGRKSLGEVTRTETFALSRASSRRLPPAERAAALKRLGNEREIQVRRRLLRTGNLELSGEHFRWISDLAVKPNGESLPRWAVTVERLEWGRFYGFPKQFTLRHPRPITTEERELAQLFDFVAANRWRLTPEQAADLDRALTPIQASLDKIKARATTRFLRQFGETAKRQLQIVLNSGQSVTSASHVAGQSVTEVHEIWSRAADAWQQFQRTHDAARERQNERRQLERDEIGEVNRRIEESRLRIRERELEYEVSAVDLASELSALSTTMGGLEVTRQAAVAAIAVAKRELPADSPLHGLLQQLAAAQHKDIAEQLREPTQRRKQLEAAKRKLPAPVQAEIDRFVAIQEQANAEAAEIQHRINELNAQNGRYELTLVTAEGQEKLLSLAEVVRAYPANQLSWLQRWAVYGSRWWEYLSDEPREANSEGGILPAIWGTVAMTLVMSLLVVPFGVLAALYLREYARAGWVISAIRISISNLAGVPSIVFGVFGLGFFCYVLGAYVDGGAANAGLTPVAPRSWWILLFVLALMALAAFGLGLWKLAARSDDRRKSSRWLGYGSLVLWLLSFGTAMVLIFANPYFGGFFEASLPNPTFGKGGLIWAALTLALLTLPVVIVATEEALAAVPNSLREGSYACGASKWQTIRRIVLPHAMPGIMTGMILAMARGAGEVAPLMLVGAVKLQPELPVDGDFPFLHLQRSFMHLGFHVYDLGFQSQNSEAAKPMVFTTTMLLIAIIACLNLTAVWIRSRLRKRFQLGQF